MTQLAALLAGIVDQPSDELRWLVLADWLEENDDPARADLLRLHRALLGTCVKPDEHPERDGWHARMMKLLEAGVSPATPQRVLALDSRVQISLAFVPPGSFLMGSPDSERLRKGDELQHLVTLSKGFFIGVHPVTQEQWMSVMGSNPSGFQEGTRPVETVSWDEAAAFCGRVSERTGYRMRLPTEAEWEYAARAGTTTPYYWVGEMDGTQANCYGSDPAGPIPVGPWRRTTTPVGNYASIAPHPWGLTDMVGNVLEWCADWYDAHYYSRSPTVDPECQDGVTGSRSMRGGSWLSVRQDARIANRYESEPTIRGGGLGFRVVVVD